MLKTYNHKQTILHRQSYLKSNVLKYTLILGLLLSLRLVSAQNLVFETSIESPLIEFAKADLQLKLAVASINLKLELQSCGPI